MDTDEFFKKPEDDDVEADEFDEDEELDNIITLNDEDGNEMQFEFLDLVESEGKEYIVLLPVDEADAGEVFLFRIEGEGDDETYVGVDNEAEADRVFLVFKEKNKDALTFED